MGSRDSPLLTVIPHLQPIQSFSISTYLISPAYLYDGPSSFAQWHAARNASASSADYMRAGGGDDVPESARRLRLPRNVRLDSPHKCVDDRGRLGGLIRTMTFVMTLHR